MRVRALWYGGSSYAAPSADDAESFPSLRAAVRLFDDRRHNRVYPETPCVTDEAEMHVYFGDGGGFDYPDRIIKFGPRGGIKVVLA